MLFMAGEDLETSKEETLAEASALLIESCSAALWGLRLYWQAAPERNRQFEIREK